MIVKEVRFPTDIAYGSSGGAGYSTVISQTSSGYETALVNWSKARHKYNATYGPRTMAQLEAVIALFHAVRGRAYGFRFKDWADYKSCPLAQPVSAFDQAIGNGDGVAVAFLLQKTYVYGSESYVRPITKPVAGTVVVSVQNATDNRWSVSTVTGVVTFSADITRSINAITKEAQGKITFTAAHGLSAGNTHHVSGVAGMTQINGKRVKVMAVDSPTQVTTDLNTTAYSTYTSGGVIHTIPQTGEVVRAGFEFDVPVRFDTDVLDISLDEWKAGAVDLPLMEVKV